MRSEENAILRFKVAVSWWWEQLIIRFLILLIMQDKLAGLEYELIRRL